MLLTDMVGDLKVGYRDSRQDSEKIAVPHF